MFKIQKLEEYSEGFKDIYKESNDYNHLVGIALMESHDSPTMVMQSHPEDDHSTWSRVVMFYQGSPVYS